MPHDSEHEHGEIKDSLVNKDRPADVIWPQANYYVQCHVIITWVQMKFSNVWVALKTWNQTTARLYYFIDFAVLFTTVQDKKTVNQNALPLVERHLMWRVYSYSTWLQSSTSQFYYFSSQVDDYYRLLPISKYASSISLICPQQGIQHLTSWSLSYVAEIVAFDGWTSQCLRIMDSEVEMWLDVQGFTLRKSCSR